MLCVGEEFGIDDGVDGLLIFVEDFEIGKLIFEVFGFVDMVIEFGIMLNCFDCLSYFGVVCEVVVMYDCDFVFCVECDSKFFWDGVGGECVDVMCVFEIVDYEGCFCYVFVVMEDVEVGLSLIWFVSKFMSIGVCSINNIVDIINYILFDIG